MRSADTLVSIIVPIRNVADTIHRTLESIRAQSFGNIETIVIDGASTDGTLALLESGELPVTRLISEPDNGVYDAINKGLRLAKGDIIGILNGDDYFVDADVVSRYVKAFRDPDLELVFADLDFFAPGNVDRTVRKYSSSSFSPEKMRYGWMPPHPTVFVRKELYAKVGKYRTDYEIAADYEFLVRALVCHQARYLRLDTVTVRMQVGGLSTAGIRATYQLNREIIRACRENGIETGWPRILLKFPAKLMELVRARL